MARHFPFGSGVNNTSGNTSYSYNHVYSDYGAGFPGGNTGIDGNRRVKVYSVGADYATGASGIHFKISKGGTPTQGGYTYVNPGGEFRFEIHYATGRLYFGRNTGNGVSTRDAADGYTWGGGLCGHFYWATVPSGPGINPVRTGNKVDVYVSASGDDGGEGISQYFVEYQKDGGAWTGQRTGGSTTYTNLASGTYRFRTWARNDVGDSQQIYSGNVFVPAAPSAPSSISLSRVGRAVTVSLGASSSNGGATISGYYVQHSADGGTTWSALVAMAADRTYTYANLDAGKTYSFRAVARNEIGDSPSVSSSIFVPAGGRRWDAPSGTWIPTTIARRWDAASGQWVDLTIARRWDAATSSWKDLT